MTRKQRIVSMLVVAVAAAGVAVGPSALPPLPLPHRSTHAVAPFVPTPAGQHAFAHAQADVAVIETTSVADLQARWQTTPDRVARVELLHSAARIPGRHGLAFLVEIAGSRDSLAAQAAADIGAITNRKLAGDLARLATSEGPAIIRANAARALAQAGTAEQAAELAALVADASAPLRVRQEAALALGHLADPDTVLTLADVLDALAADRSDSAVQLRISIVQALGAVRCEAAHDALLRHRARALSSTELAFVDRALTSSAAG